MSYSLIDRRIEKDVLPFCQDNGLTVIAYSPLGHDPDRIEARFREALDKVVRETGKTEEQVSLNWVLSQGSNVMVIPKSNSVEHTEQNCMASGWNLSEEHIRLLDEASRDMVRHSAL